MSEIVHVRASSFGELLDCAHRWEGKYILNLKKPANMAAHLGISLHKSTAVHDTAIMREEKVTPDDTAEEFIYAMTHPDYDVKILENDYTPKKAEEIGLTLHRKYCGEITPKFSYEAVELKPKPLDIDTQRGVILRLTGTMDRTRVRKSKSIAKGGKNINTADGNINVHYHGIAINDLKSGRQAVNAKGEVKTKIHGPQLGVYELLAEHTLGLPVTEPSQIIGLQTTRMARVGIGALPNTRAQLVGTEDSPGLIDMVANMLKTGLFPPNPSSMLCSEKYCPRWQTCRFKG